MRTARTVRFTALLLALCCALSVWVLPAAGETYLAYTAASLRLREKPSENATVLLTIPAGGVVVITGESGNFYAAIYEGVSGYAMKQYLTLMAAPAATPKPAASAYAVLYTGSQGDQVKTLQTALKSLGYYTSAVDGKYGSGTAKAVTAFQKANGLNQTGIADVNTQTLLFEGAPVNSAGVSITQSAAYAALSTGSSGNAVKQLQTRLKALGYYTGSVDGKYGSGTAKAVTAFQKKNGIAQTGTADSMTQAALYASSAISANATATPAPTPTPTPLPTLAPAKTGAATYPYTTYTLSSVNLRDQASTASARLLTIPKGAEVSVLSTSGDYLRVTYKGKTGYVVAEYVYVPAQYLPGAALNADPVAQQHYPYLQSGSSGKQVTVLQEALKELGFYTGTADGSFGAATLTALKAFQKKNGLKQDGVASPELQQLIFEGRPLNVKGQKTDVKILPNVPGIEMKSGDKGEPVTQLQTQLKSLGFYAGTPTGVFDSATLSAVKKFQQAHSLYVDGIAGTKTQLLLNTITSTATPAPYTAPTAAPVTMAPAATALTAQNVTVLRSGARGQAVVQLQNRLMELGYYACVADGVYDADDIQAVRAFQQKNGLTIDGVAGLITQQRLYSAYALPATTAALPLPTATPVKITPTPTAAPSLGSETLRIGSQGSAVALLQSKLKELGYYTGTADGIFGTVTAAAVTAFQRANGLTADGIAGEKTLSKLTSAKAVAAKATAAPAATAAPTATLLKSGDKGDAVKAMQQQLVKLGYLSSADGIYGPVTYNAVVAFQRRNGLTADGIAGKLTLNKLNSSSAVAATAASTLPAASPSPVVSTAFKAPSPSEVRYANWYSEIRAIAKQMPDVVIYDPDSGLHFNLHMFSFGKHADCETPTAADTEILYQINGKDNWTPKYVWVIFSDGRVYIGSIHSHGHEVDHTPGNGLEGHICLHFPRVMSEAEATGPYAVSHQKEILWGWELTQAKIK